MSQVCDSIDTLSMTYLDEELAPEEKRELELHLLECAACRNHVQEERQEVEMLRHRLATPPTPDLVRAKVVRMLDREDAQVQRSMLRERIGRWFLPGTSIAAAAAALLVFAFLRTPQSSSQFGRGLARQQQEPMQVTGAATQPWLEQQMAGTVVPRFDGGVELVGGLITQIDDRAVAKLVYQMGPQQFQLEAYLFRARGIDLEVGRAVQTDSGRTLHVSSVDGLPAIAYVDENQVAYVFMSRDLSERALLSVVLNSELIDRARGGR
jgi:anti-sigma factor RsiW